MTREWLSVRNRGNPKLDAVSNIRNDNSATLKALSFLDRARSLLEQEKSNSAAAYLRQINVSTLRGLSKANYFELLGQTHQLLGNVHRAEHEFRRAFALYSRLTDSFGLIHVLQKRGDVARQLEKFKDASACYKLAKKEILSLPKSQQNNWQRKYIDIEVGLALSIRGLGNYAEAIQCLKKIVPVYQTLNDHSGEAYALWALGTTQRFAGQFNDAEHNLRRSLRKYTALKDAGGAAYASCGLGGTLRMKIHPRESGLLYKKANIIFQKLDDNFGLAYSFCGQGNALRMQGKYRKGIPFMKKAIALYKKLGQRGPRAFVLWSLAQSEIALRQFSGAEKHLSESEILFRQVNDRRGLTYVQLGWGEYLRCKEDSRWKSQFLKAYRLAKNNKLIFEAQNATSRLNSVIQPTHLP